jgi:hypothetical protein
MSKSDSLAGNSAHSGASSSLAGANHQPVDGDLVVVRKPGATPPFGVLRVLQVPTGVQFGASTREAALQLARSFAQAHKIDLWYREQDDHKLLERYRPSLPAR